MLKKCRKVFRIKNNTNFTIVNKAQNKKRSNMKNLITYFTPRNTDERNSLLGMFAGILILSIVFYFYSL